MISGVEPCRPGDSVHLESVTVPGGALISFTDILSALVSLIILFLNREISGRKTRGDEVYHISFTIRSNLPLDFKKQVCSFLDYLLVLIITSKFLADTARCLPTIYASPFLGQRCIWEGLPC